MNKDTETQNVSEIDDRFFNHVVQHVETGDFERLRRNENVNGIEIINHDTNQSVDETSIEEFNEDDYYIVPDEVVEDPVGYLENHLENRNEEGAYPNTMQHEISLEYAIEHTEIVEA